MEPGYIIENKWAGYVHFYAREAEDQDRINEFLRKVEQEHHSYTFGYDCGGIKMTFDWFGMEGPDRATVERITRKVYNYLKRFKRVRINP